MADVLWQMEAEGRVLTTPEARAGLQTALDQRVSQIADKTVQSLYRDEMRKRFYDAFRARPAFQPQPQRGWQGGGGTKGRGFRQPRTTDPPPDYRPSRPVPPAEKRERVLLAILLNHPELFDEVGETLGDTSFSVESLETLRQAVVFALSQNPGLDAAGLGSHLCEIGFSGFEDLIGSAVYVHAPFARPDSTLEEARLGWRDVGGQAHIRHVRAELLEAAQALARETSVDNLARLRALQREAEAGAEEIDNADLDLPRP
jgi:DNA primase